MRIILSPAKKMNIDTDTLEHQGLPVFLDQTKEILEGQRRYREQMASQYTAGYTDAEEKLNAVIAEKDAIISDKDALIAKLQAELDSFKK